MRAGFALLVLGLGLRTWWALGDRSLWHDELMLVLNVLSKPLPELLGQPLAFNQTSPPLFLALEWVVSRFDFSELALRLPSLVSGIVLLPAFWWLARQLLPAGGAVLALLLVACSPALLRYSAEVKPYGLAALASVAIMALGLQALRNPDEPRLRRLLVAGVIATATILPSPFILAGVWLALAVASAPALRGRKLGWLSAMGVTWAIVFLPFYLYLYLPVSSDPFMQRFWHGAFLPLQVEPAYQIHRRWTIGVVFGPQEVGVIPGMGGVLTGVAALGLWALWRRGGWSLVMLVAGPLALTYAASLFGGYPIEVRLMLFAAPNLILLLAAGVSALPEVVSARFVRPLQVVTAAVLAAPGPISVAAGAEAVTWVENSGVVLRDPAVHSYPSEPVYVFIRAMPAWIYYTTDWSAPDLRHVRRLIELTEAQGPAGGNAPSRRRPVRREGWDLVMPSGPRRLLVGVSSGFEALFRAGWEEVPTDSGWGGNEAERMLAEASPCFWVFFAHHKYQELDDVRRSLEDRGAWAAQTLVQPGAELFRYCRSWDDDREPPRPRRIERPPIRRPAEHDAAGDAPTESRGFVAPRDGMIP